MSAANAKIKLLSRGNSEHFEGGLARLLGIQGLNFSRADLKWFKTILRITRPITACPTAFQNPQQPNLN